MATMIRRRKKLVRLDVQVRVILIALCVASLVLLVNFYLTFMTITNGSAAVTGPVAVRLLLDNLRHSILNQFLISIGLSIPLAIGIGVLYSFRFAGPIYRFKKYFTELATGRWNVRCSLRQGDDLQDVCDAINAALDPMRKALEESHGILKELLASQGENSEALASVRERILAARALYEARFPPSPGPAAASPVSCEATREKKELQPQT